MKIVVAITGASGIELAKKFIQHLEKDIEIYVITSDNAITVNHFEHPNITLYENSNIAASVASGSFQVDITVVIPCSMNSLAKIACGIADNLVTRAAAVAIKEQKKLLLAPREMPFSAIALENMEKLAKLNVIIAPPVMGYYSNSQTKEDIEMFIVGKWFDVLGLENNLYKRWQ